MQNGGEPITFEEISALDVSGLEVPRVGARWTSRPVLPVSLNGREPRSLRVPAIAWAGFLGIVLVAIVIGVSVSGSRSPSTTAPAHHGKNGEGTTLPSVRPAPALTVPNVVGTSANEAIDVLTTLGLQVDKHIVSSPGSRAGLVEAQTPSAGSVVPAGSVVEILVSGTPTTTVASSTPLGIFTDGKEGQPYYFISVFGTVGNQVHGAPPSQLNGAVDLVHQDGQTSVLFTFDGSWDGTHLTLHRTSSSHSSPGVPETIQGTTSVGLISTIELDGCASYLVNVTDPCTFGGSSTGLATSGPAPTVGTYSDGSAGTPHYLVTITSSNGDDLEGSVSYLDQDGRVAQLFSFFGLFQDRVATVTERSFGLNPPTISVALGNGQLNFGECFNYMQSISSNAQCTFTLASG
jgi:hypothetical protein